MERLKTPIMLDAIYLILLGLSTLSSGLVSSVFGYTVKDPGVLLVLSGTFLGFGVVVWDVFANLGKYGGLATALVVADAIGTLFLLYGWTSGLYTARNALLPLIINVVLGVWIWSARPKSS
jgi:hypothetical protein